MIIDSNDFTNSLKNYESAPEPSFRMAKVTAYTSGKLYLTFYGEDTQRQKAYKRLASYSPAVGDTVICARLNGSYTVLGKVV